MTIMSERLLIRSYTEDDAPALHTILGDPTTMGFWPQPFDRAESDAWLRRAIQHRDETFCGRRAVVLLHSGELIGEVGVVRAVIDGEERADLGYIIHHPYWRRGYAVEAAGAMASHCFTCGHTPIIYANMAHDHIGSQRVAEHLGMRRVGEFANPRNRGIRTFLYALTAEEWLARLG